MKIAWIHDHLKHYNGGTKFILEMCSRLRQDHDLIFCSPRISLYNENMLQCKFIPYDTQLPIGKNDIVIASSPIAHITAPFLYKKVINLYFEPNSWLYDNNFIMSAPAIYRIVSKVGIFDRITNEAMHRATATITINEYSALKASALWGINSWIVHTGCSPNYYYPQHSWDIEKKYRENTLILHVASYLNQVKGTKFCIEALSKAIRIFPDFQLLVFNAHSNIKKQQELYEYARLLNAENNIKFKPFVEESEMPKYYSAAKFVLQPSMPATTLMSIHEGACCEIPAIAFDCGAASEDIAHEETGLLVQPYDTDALSKAMIRLHSFVESDRMGKAARKRSSLLFNWDIEYQKLLRIIETC